MVNLAAEKVRLEKRLEAITLIEGLDADQLVAVRDVLASTPASSTEATEQCPECGQYFRPNGIKRHITVVHG